MRWCYGVDDELDDEPVALRLPKAERQRDAADRAPRRGKSSFAAAGGRGCRLYKRLEAKTAHTDPGSPPSVELSAKLSAKPRPT